MVFRNGRYDAEFARIDDILNPQDIANKWAMAAQAHDLATASLKDKLGRYEFPGAIGQLSDLSAATESVRDLLGNVHAQSLSRSLAEAEWAQPPAWATGQSAASARPLEDAWSSFSFWQASEAMKSALHQAAPWTGEADRTSRTYMDGITAAQSAGTGALAPLDELVAKAREYAAPLTSMYEDLTARISRKGITDVAAMADRWHRMQTDPADMLSQTTRLALDKARRTVSLLSDQTIDVGALGVTDALRSLLNTPSHLGSLDVGLLSQSIVAANLVEVSRYDQAALAGLHGRSLLVDTFIEVDRFLARGAANPADGTGTAAAVDADDAVADLFGQILLIFQGYLAKAKTAYERESLLNLLGFMMNMVTLVVTLQMAADTSLEQAVTKQTAVIEEKLDRVTKTLEVIGKTMEAVSNTLDGIDQKLAEAAEPERKADHYVVLRAVPMKERKAMKSRTLATLHPNQVVLLLTRDQNWIEIEYFDHLAGETLTGWVVKKHLKLMRY